MAQSFKGKSVEEIFDYLSTHEPADLQEVSDIVDALDPKLRKEVVDLLEQEMVGALRDTAQEYEGYKMLNDTFGGLVSIFEDAADKAARKQEEAEVVSAMQTVSLYIKYVADVKGDAAHPVIKETLNALSELSDADYNDVNKIMQAWTKGYDTGIAQQPPAAIKPNPFKKPQGPKQ